MGYSVICGVLSIPKRQVIDVDTVTILGARGSVPRAGADFAKYGGNTTCILAQLGGETIILDAGTGLMELPSPGDGSKRASLLLTHAHVDHLLGLPLCPLLMDSASRLDIYSRSRNGLDTEAQINLLISPPLWPVRVSQLPADVLMMEMPMSFSIGSVTVETIEGIHPGGVTLIKLIHGDRSVAFVTDCTLTDAIMPTVTEFARGCSLLLCDGQYSDEEWESRRSFGHSTWSRAVQLGLACGAEKVRIVHHDPTHTDRMLDAAAGRLAAEHSDCSFAMAMEEIIL